MSYLREITTTLYQSLLRVARRVIRGHPSIAPEDLVNTALANPSKGRLLSDRERAAAWTKVLRWTLLTEIDRERRQRKEETQDLEQLSPTEWHEVQSNFDAFIEKAAAKNDTWATMLELRRRGYDFTEIADHLNIETKLPKDVVRREWHKMVSWAQQSANEDIDP
jgi:hypothetical protein